MKRNKSEDPGQEAMVDESKPSKYIDDNKIVDQMCEQSTNIDDLKRDNSKRRTKIRQRSHQKKTESGDRNPFLEFSTYDEFVDSGKPDENLGR